jgi:two-component system OmpR family response regulator
MSHIRTVLIVDDEPSIREILSRSLGKAGYETHAVAGPLEASRAFLEHTIDAVILDLRMRDLSGFRFLDWLRTEPNERAQTVPVFILTGHELTTDEQETLRRQHAEIFFKPQGMEDIVTALTRLRTDDA